MIFITKRFGVHGTLVLFFIAAFAFGWYRQMFILLFFITMHEMAHILMAYVFGGHLRQMHITPLGERALLEGLEEMGFCRRMIVFLAGPCMSLALGGICYAFLPQYPFLYGTNFAFGFFNLLPVLPLDGGMLMFHVLGRHIGVLKAARLMAGVSRIGGMAIVFLGVLQMVLFPFQCSLFVIGIFIILNTKREHIGMVSQFYCFITSKPVCGGRVRYVLARNENLRHVIRQWNYDDYFVTLLVNEQEEVKAYSMHFVLREASVL